MNNNPPIKYNSLLQPTREINQPKRNNTPLTTNSLINKVMSLLPTPEKEGGMATSSIQPFNLSTPIYGDNHNKYLDLSYISPSDDIDELRARNQSGSGQVIHGLGKTGIRIAGTIVNSILAPVDILQSLITDGNMYSGALSTAIDTLYEKAEEWMPNYYTAHEQAVNKVISANFIADKAFKNAAFTIGTIASMVLTAGISGGAILSGLKLFSKTNKQLSSIASKIAMAEAAGYADDAASVVAKLSKSGKLTSANLARLESFANIRLAKTANKINKLYQLNSASLFESASETREGMRRIGQALIEEGYDPNSEIYQDKMDKAGKSIFATNMAVLTLSNSLMYYSLFKSNAFKKLRPNKNITKHIRFMDDASKTAIIDGGLTGSAAIGTIKPGIRTAKNIIGKPFKLTKNIASEGWEEGMQYSAQTAALQKALYGEEYSDFDNYTVNLLQSFKNIGLYKEGRESVLLGSLTGGMASIIKGGVSIIKGEDAKIMHEELRLGREYIDKYQALVNFNPDNESGKELREFLDYYKDKSQTGEDLYNALLRSDTEVKEINDILYRLNEASTAESPNAELIEKLTKDLLFGVSNSRTTQLHSLSNILSLFEANGATDKFYEALDTMAEQSDTNFAVLIGKEVGESVSPEDKAIMIADLKKQAEKAEQVNLQISTLLRTLPKDEIYTLTDKGLLPSPLISELHSSLINLAAYGEERSSLIESFDSIMLGEDGFKVSYAELEALADQENISIAQALERTHEEYKNKKIASLANDKRVNISSTSIELDSISERIKLGKSIISAISNVDNALLSAAMAKTKLEAALLNSKERKQENIRLKKETVKKYINDNLNIASSLDELDLIEEHLLKHGIDKQLFTTELNKRKAEVSSLVNLRSKYIDAVKNDTLSKNEITELNKRIKSIEDKLKSKNKTGFRLDRLDELFKATASLREAERKQIKEKKESTKQNNASKKTSTPTTSLDKSTPKVTPEEEKLVVPKDAKLAIREVFNDKLNDSTIDTIANLQYVDENDTNLICDPKTGKVIGKGSVKARNGLTTSFTVGGSWSIVKSFKGKSHTHGGIDIVINNGNISMSGKDANIKAANGVLITGRDYIKDDIDNPPLTNMQYDNDNEDKIKYVNSLIKSGGLVKNKQQDGYTTGDLKQIEKANKYTNDEYKFLHSWYRSKGARDRFIQNGGTNEEWNIEVNNMLGRLDKANLRELKYNDLPNVNFHGRKGHTQRYADGTSDVISLNPNESSLTHEFTHSMKPESINKINSIVEKITSNKKYLKDSPYNKEVSNYLLSPPEVYSRINQIRYDANLKPNEIITIERLNEYINDPAIEVDELLEILNEEGVLILLNSLADNNNTLPNKLT